MTDQRAGQLNQYMAHHSDTCESGKVLSDKEAIQKLKDDAQALMKQYIEQTEALHSNTGSTDAIEDSFVSMLTLLHCVKPNDRSAKDRSMAVLITEVEKAKAWYMAYCRGV